MLTRPVRRSLSSSLATTRSHMRPTVSQSMRRNLTIVVLSVLVARYAATSSKSRPPDRAHLTSPPACHRSAYPATNPAVLIASTHPHPCRESLISRLNVRPTRTPVHASPAPSRAPTQDSGPTVDPLLLRCRALPSVNPLKPWRVPL